MTGQEGESICSSNNRILYKYESVKKTVGIDDCAREIRLSSINPITVDYYYANRMLMDPPVD